MLEELQERLEVHDWYYEFRSSSASHELGRRNRVRILELKKEVDPEIFKELWNKYAPENKQIN